LTSVTPLFEFILVVVGVGSLAPLLTAVLLAARRRCPARGASRRLVLAEMIEACFIMRDPNWQMLAHVYFRG
jgi:hypothetical protein